MTEEWNSESMNRIFACQPLNLICNVWAVSFFLGQMELIAAYMFMRNIVYKCAAFSIEI